MNEKERKQELIRLGIKEKSVDSYLEYLHAMTSPAKAGEVASDLHVQGDIYQMLLEPFRILYHENPSFKRDVLIKLENICSIPGESIEEYLLHRGDLPYMGLEEDFYFIPKENLECLVNATEEILLNKIREHLGYENAN